MLYSLTLFNRYGGFDERATCTNGRAKKRACEIRSKCCVNLALPYLGEYVFKMLDGTQEQEEIL
jgi:hypothetical protein